MIGAFPDQVVSSARSLELRDANLAVGGVEADGPQLARAPGDILESGSSFGHLLMHELTTDGPDRRLQLRGLIEPVTGGF